MSRIDGTSEADTLIGVPGDFNVLVGLGGDDTLIGSTSYDHLYGDAGQDSLAGGDSVDQLSGGTGDDVLHGGAGNDNLQAGDGNDRLFGEGGEDYLDGGAGSDTYHVTLDGGPDSIHETGRINWFSLFTAHDAAVGDGDGVEVTDSAPFGTATRFDAHELGELEPDATCSVRVDSLYGNLVVKVVDQADNIIASGTASDGDYEYTNPVSAQIVFTPQAGNTYRVLVGADHDGFAAYDLAVEAGYDNLDTDVLLVGPGVSAADLSLSLADNYDFYRAVLLHLGAANQVWLGDQGVGGHGGIEEVHLADLSIVLLADLFAQANTPTDAHQTLVGLSATDNIDALGGDDKVSSFEGNDTLRGNLGNDSLFGGNGRDSLAGDAGNDVIVGDAGADILLGGLQDDSVWGGNAMDTLYGDEGDDQLHGGNQGDWIFTGTGNNLARGDGQNDVLHGGGIDTLYGNGGNDRLYGWAGEDRLDGGRGNDFLHGGTGNDILTGGWGSDTFFFGKGIGNGIDRITDFSQADGDSLRIARAATDITAAGALDAALFTTGTAASTADQRFVFDATSGALYYDADGAGAGSAFHFATLATGTTLFADDIILT